MPEHDVINVQLKDASLPGVSSPAVLHWDSFTCGYEGCDVMDSNFFNSNGLKKKKSDIIDKIVCEYSIVCHVCRRYRKNITVTLYREFSFTL